MDNNIVIEPNEVNFFVQNITKFQINEIGNTKWFTSHEALLRLSQLAVVEAKQYTEQMVKNMLMENDKVNIIIHEAIAVLVWKNKVLPKLIESNEPNFILYTILFHEASAISLLETILYHDDVCEGITETCLDLIDYCAQAITKFISSAPKQKSESKDIKNSSKDEFHQQKFDLDFKIGMKCITILFYLIDKIDKCPLSAVTRLVRVHDIPYILSEILHLRPWIRKQKEYEKYIDSKWVVAKGESILIVTKAETQTWFALRQILLNPVLFNNYEVNDYRQRQLSRCLGLLHEQLLDQLPVLSELKYFLSSLTISGNKSKQNLMLEEIPEIQDKLVSNAKKIGWKLIVEQHKNELMISDKNKIIEIAKQIQTAYNLDNYTYENDSVNLNTNADINFCENCKQTAIKKCSQCKSIYYCSRECQVKHWKFHKNLCSKTD